MSESDRGAAASTADRTPPSRGRRDDVAVVGMSCLFAGAEGLAAYWSNVLDKVDAVGDVPPGRWDARPHLEADPGDAGSIRCARGAFLADTFCFDPVTLRVPPSAVRGADPDQFLVLRCVREALADAGCVEGLDAERTETVIGRTANGGGGAAAFAHRAEGVRRASDILEAFDPGATAEHLARASEEMLADLPPFGAETVPGVVPNVVAGRVANRFGFGGANFLVDAACATGLVAAEQAVRGLLSGASNVAVVGAVHVGTGPALMAMFDRLGALSRDGVCRPFHADSDGTVIGEGVGVVVLQRLEDARRAGKRIYAVVKGIGTSSDGRSTALLSPSAKGERLAIDRAWAMAGVAPRTAGLVEAHGTGTVEGDRVELEVLNGAFADAGAGSVAVGSVKSMIGHTMVAAGIASLIKTALALHQRTLPPTANCERPHKLLRQAGSPLALNPEMRPWLAPADGGPRRAGVSAFGFGGVNAHAVLEEHRGADQGEAVALYRRWPCEVFVLGAHSRRELAEQAERLAQDLDGGAPDAGLAEVACALNAEFAETASSGGDHRLAVVAEDLADLAGKLRRSAVRLDTPEAGNIHDRSGIYYYGHPLDGKVALLFPGEASPYLGMAGELAVVFPSVRLAVERFDAALREAGAEAVGPFVFPPWPFGEDQRRQAEAALQHVDRAALVAQAADLAMLALVRLLGVEPDMACGHSAGERAAMVAGGMIDDVAVARLHAGLLGVDMSDIPPAAMIAVGTDLERAASLVREFDGAEIANDNCPHQTVVAVPPEREPAFAARCRERRFVAEGLPVNVPVHTRRYESLVEPLKDAFFSVDPSPPEIPVYACSTASPFPRDRKGVVETASASLARPVRFRETVERMYAEGARFFVEAGPRNVLSGFVRDVLAGQPHHAVPLDEPGRRGIAGLLHALGQLWARGVAPKLDALYGVRGIEAARLTEILAGRRSGSEIDIPLATPQLGLPRPRPVRVPAAPEAELPERSDDFPEAGIPQASDAEAAMNGYFDAMEQFVRSQERVLAAWMDTHKTP